MNSHPRELPVLRATSLVETLTLLLLLCVGVPLKHLLGRPAAVSVLGPLHGLAFATYVWAVWQAMGEGRLSWREARRCLLFAFLPGGAWLNWRRLLRSAPKARA